MRVLLFGRFADVAGWREREVTPAPPTLRDLVGVLAEQEPGLATELGARWTLTLRNKQQVRGEVDLAADDEIGFMPPMSGG